MRYIRIYPRLISDNTFMIVHTLLFLFNHYIPAITTSNEKNTRRCSFLYNIYDPAAIAAYPVLPAVRPLHYLPDVPQAFPFPFYAAAF